MDDRREFKIDLHADDSEEGPTENTAFSDTAKKSSSRTPVLLVVFVLIVFGGVIGFLYYHFNSRIRVITNRGSAGIASLSIDLNQKIADVSKQVADQQETMSTLLANLDDQLKKLNTSVSTLQTSKPDKKDLNSAINNIREQLAPLQESIKNLKESVTNLRNETDRISTGLRKVETGVLNNKKEINTLDAIGVNKNSLEQAFKKEREFNQQNMAHAYEALFSEIATLQDRIKTLEKKSGHTGAAPAPKRSSGKTKSPSSNLSVPKPGKIIEQEIQ